MRSSQEDFFFFSFLKKTLGTIKNLSSCDDVIVSKICSGDGFVLKKCFNLLIIVPLCCFDNYLVSIDLPIAGYASNTDTMST